MWLLTKTDLMSFVTDVVGPRKNQTYIVPNFSTNIGGRGNLFNQYFKIGWGKSFS